MPRSTETSPQFTTPLTRSTLVGLTLIFFFTQVAFAHLPESNFWAERQQAIQETRKETERKEQLTMLPGLGAGSLEAAVPLSPLSLEKLTAGEFLPEHLPAATLELIKALPQNTGTIRKITLPKQQKINRVVVQIQDVHRNPDAQKNIGAAVASLMAHGSVGLVALEGTASPIPLNKIHAFPRPDIVRSVADYLLRENNISGPVYAGMTQDGTVPPFLGIDDSAHYNANVQAYRDSIPLAEGTKHHIADLQNNARRESKTVFNADLAAFEAKADSFHRNKMPLGLYLRYLSAQLSETPASVRTFLDALSFEETLNFSQVETERSQLLERLTQVLKKDELARLLQWSVAYRLGMTRTAGFYRALEELCDQKGVSLNQYPAMKSYIHYVLAAERVDAEQLLQDARKMEETLQDRRIKTPAERHLVQEMNYLDLTEKLADFSLTPEEWKEYNRTQIPGLHLTLAPFESFYREAEQRDKAMAHNLLDQMDRQNSPVAVVVTGGFHTNSMAKMLSDAGVATISFVPKLSKVDTSQGSAYLSVFAQEKTPLEKLVTGEKLFLAQDPTLGLKLAGPLSAGVEPTPEGVAAANKISPVKITEAHKTDDGSEVTIGEESEAVVLDLSLQHQTDNGTAAIVKIRQTPKQSGSTMRRFRAEAIFLLGLLVWQTSENIVWGADLDPLFADIGTDPTRIIILGVVVVAITLLITTIGTREKPSLELKPLQEPRPAPKPIPVRIKAEPKPWLIPALKRAGAFGASVLSSTLSNITYFGSSLGGRLSRIASAALSIATIIGTWIGDQWITGVAALTLKRASMALWFGNKLRTPKSPRIVFKPQILQRQPKQNRLLDILRAFRWEIPFFLLNLWDTLAEPNGKNNNGKSDSLNEREHKSALERLEGKLPLSPVVDLGIPADHHSMGQTEFSTTFDAQATHHNASSEAQSVNPVVTQTSQQSHAQTPASQTSHSEISIHPHPADLLFAGVTHQQLDSAFGDPHLMEALAPSLGARLSDTSSNQLTNKPPLTAMISAAPAATNHPITQSGPVTVSGIEKLYAENGVEVGVEVDDSVAGNNLTVLIYQENNKTFKFVETKQEPGGQPVVILQTTGSFTKLEGGLPTEGVVVNPSTGNRIIIAFNYINDGGEQTVTQIDVEKSSGTPILIVNVTATYNTNIPTTPTTTATPVLPPNNPSPNLTQQVIPPAPMIQLVANIPVKRDFRFFFGEVKKEEPPEPPPGAVNPADIENQPPQMPSKIQTQPRPAEEAPAAPVDKNDAGEEAAAPIKAASVTTAATPSAPAPTSPAQAAGTAGTDSQSTPHPWIFSIPFFGGLAGALQFKLSNKGPAKRSPAKITLFSIATISFAGATAVLLAHPNTFSWIELAIYAVGMAVSLFFLVRELKIPRNTSTLPAVLPFLSLGGVNLFGWIDLASSDIRYLLAGIALVAFLLGVVGPRLAKSPTAMKTTATVALHSTVLVGIGIIAYWLASVSTWYWGFTWAALITMGLLAGNRIDALTDKIFKKQSPDKGPRITRRQFHGTVLGGTVAGAASYAAEQPQPETDVPLAQDPTNPSTEPELPVNTPKALVNPPAAPQQRPDTFSGASYILRDNPSVLSLQAGHRGKIYLVEETPFELSEIDVNAFKTELAGRPLIKDLILPAGTDLDALTPQKILHFLNTILFEQPGFFQKAMDAGVRKDALHPSVAQTILDKALATGLNIHDEQGRVETLRLNRALLQALLPQSLANSVSPITSDNHGKTDLDIQVPKGRPMFRIIDATLTIGNWAEREKARPLEEIYEMYRKLHKKGYTSEAERLTFLGNVVQQLIDHMREYYDEDISKTLTAPEDLTIIPSERPLGVAFSGDKILARYQLDHICPIQVEIPRELFFGARTLYEVWISQGENEQERAKTEQKVIRVLHNREVAPVMEHEEGIYTGKFVLKVDDPVDPSKEIHYRVKPRVGQTSEFATPGEEYRSVSTTIGLRHREPVAATFTPGILSWKHEESTRVEKDAVIGRIDTTPLKGSILTLDSFIAELETQLKTVPGLLEKGAIAPADANINAMIQRLRNAQKAKTIVDETNVTAVASESGVLVGTPNRGGWLVTSNSGADVLVYEFRVPPSQVPPDWLKPGQVVIIRTPDGAKALGKFVTREQTPQRPGEAVDLSRQQDLQLMVLDRQFVLGDNQSVWLDSPVSPKEQEKQQKNFDAERNAPFLEQEVTPTSFVAPENLPHDMLSTMTWEAEPRNPDRGSYQAQLADNIIKEQNINNRIAALRYLIDQRGSEEWITKLVMEGAPDVAETVLNVLRDEYRIEDLIRLHHQSLNDPRHGPHSNIPRLIYAHVIELIERGARGSLNDGADPLPLLARKERGTVIRVAAENLLSMILSNEPKTSLVTRRILASGFWKPPEELLALARDLDQQGHPEAAQWITEIVKARVTYGIIRGKTLTPFQRGFMESYFFRFFDPKLFSSIIALPTDWEMDSRHLSSSPDPLLNDIRDEFQKEADAKFAELQERASRRAVHVTLSPSGGPVTSDPNFEILDTTRRAAYIKELGEDGHYYDLVRLLKMPGKTYQAVRGDVIDSLLGSMEGRFHLAQALDPNTPESLKSALVHKHFDDLLVADALSSLAVKTLPNGQRIPAPLDTQKDGAAPGALFAYQTALAVLFRALPDDARTNDSGQKQPRQRLALRTIMRLVPSAYSLGAMVRGEVSAVSTLLRQFVPSDNIKAAAETEMILRSWMRAHEQFIRERERLLEEITPGEEVAFESLLQSIEIDRYNPTAFKTQLTELEDQEPNAIHELERQARTFHRQFTGNAERPTAPQDKVMWTTLQPLFYFIKGSALAAGLAVLFGWLYSGVRVRAGRQNLVDALRDHNFSDNSPFSYGIEPAILERLRIWHRLLSVPGRLTPENAVEISAQAQKILILIKRQISPTQLRSLESWKTQTLTDTLASVTEMFLLTSQKISEQGPPVALPGETPPGKHLRDLETAEWRFIAENLWNMTRFAESLRSMTQAAENLKTTYRRHIARPINPENLVERVWFMLYNSTALVVSTIVRVAYFITFGEMYLRWAYAARMQVSIAASQSLGGHYFEPAEVAETLCLLGASSMRSLPNWLNMVLFILLGWLPFGPFKKGPALQRPTRIRRRSLSQTLAEWFENQVTRAFSVVTFLTPLLLFSMVAYSLQGGQIAMYVWVMAEGLSIFTIVNWGLRTLPILFVWHVPDSNGNAFHMDNFYEDIASWSESNDAETPAAYTELQTARMRAAHETNNAGPQRDIDVMIVVYGTDLTRGFNIQNFLRPRIRPDVVQLYIPQDINGSLGAYLAAKTALQTNYDRLREENPSLPANMRDARIGIIMAGGWLPDSDLTPVEQALWRAEEGARALQRIGSGGEVIVKSDTDDTGRVSIKPEENISLQTNAESIHRMLRQRFGIVSDRRWDTASKKNAFRFIEPVLLLNPAELLEELKDRVDQNSPWGKEVDFDNEGIGQMDAFAGTTLINYGDTDFLQNYNNLIDRLQEHIQEARTNDIARDAELGLVEDFLIPLILRSGGASGTDLDTYYDRRMEAIPHSDARRVHKKTRDVHDVAQVPSAQIGTYPRAGSILTNLHPRTPPPTTGFHSPGLLFAAAHTGGWIGTIIFAAAFLLLAYQTNRRFKTWADGWINRFRRPTPNPQLEELRDLAKRITRNTGFYNYFYYHAEPRVELSAETRIALVYNPLRDFNRLLMKSELPFRTKDRIQQKIKASWLNPGPDFSRNPEELIFIGREFNKIEGMLSKLQWPQRVYKMPLPLLVLGSLPLLMGAQGGNPLWALGWTAVFGTLALFAHLLTRQQIVSPSLPETHPPLTAAQKISEELGPIRPLGVGQLLPGPSLELAAANTMGVRDGQFDIEAIDSALNDTIDVPLGSSKMDGEWAESLLKKYPNARFRFLVDSEAKGLAELLEGRYKERIADNRLKVERVQDLITAEDDNEVLHARTLVNYIQSTERSTSIYLRDDKNSTIENPDSLKQLQGYHLELFDLINNAVLSVPSTVNLEDMLKTAETAATNA